MGAAARILSERASRAGKKPNQVVLDAALEAMTEACLLANEGHTIVALYVTRDGRPSIQLERSHHLAELVSAGKAVYCAHGIGKDGQRRRKGELLGRGCRVTWLEVGH